MLLRSACALVLPTTFYNSPSDTWLGFYGYAESKPEEVYVASFYLTLQVICGAAGGDLDKDAFNMQEQVSHHLTHDCRLLRE